MNGCEFSLLIEQDLRDVVREIFILNLPGVSYEKGFATLVNWARYGDLFAYDDKSGLLSSMAHEDERRFQHPSGGH